MKFDVITFGSALIDVFVNTDISEKNNFIYYSVGAKILIKELRFDIGGGGTNTATAFARFGFKTGYIGKLGNDNNAKDILNFLKKEKISFLGKIDTKEKTGYSVILDSKGGERTILTYKGANNNLNFNEIPKTLQTDWLYYSALMEKSLETQVKLAKILVKKGTKLAFNPSLYLIKEINLKPLLALTTILILNKEEAELLCKKNSLNEKKPLTSLAKLGPKIIVITNKDKLISCYGKKQKYFLKPHNKIKIVERTGAGDAFASGFVAGQIVGKSIKESLNLGLKESEAVLGHFGAKNNLIRMKLK